MAIGDAAFSRGDIMRRMQKVEDDLREIRAARSLEAATIREGGLRVKGGTVRIQNDGSIIVEDGGDIQVIEGGDVSVSGGGDVRVIDGGSVVVQGSGDIRVEEGSTRLTLADAAMRMLLGGLTGEQEGLVKAVSNGAGRTAIRIEAPFVNGNGDENAVTIEGWTDASAGGWFVDTGGDAFIRPAGAIVAEAGTNAFLEAVQQIQLTSGDNQVFISHGTTTASANCFIGSSTGIIQRSTSARRFKLDIADLDVDLASVLALRPRTWRDRGEVESGSPTPRSRTEQGERESTPSANPRRIPGFVAEEVAEIPGLDVFVTRDDNGEVESVAYDRLTAVLVSAVQAQQRQLDAQQQQIDALASSVRALGGILD